jgi:hypothetical protein
MTLRVVRGRRHGRTWMETPPATRVSSSLSARRLPNTLAGEHLADHGDFPGARQAVNTHGDDVEGRRAQVLPPDPEPARRGCPAERRPFRRSSSSPLENLESSPLERLGVWDAEERDAEARRGGVLRRMRPARPLSAWPASEVIS